MDPASQKTGSRKSRHFTRRKERNLTLEYYDEVIDQWETQYHQNPNDAAIQSSWEEAINNRKLYQKNQLESLVQRYPNDLVIVTNLVSFYLKKKTMIIA